MRKARLTIVDPSDYTDSQAEMATMLANKLGSESPSGPFSILIRTPHLLDGMMSQLMASKAENFLEMRLFTLAILIVARHWKAQFEWVVHSPRAAMYGISDLAIEAIRLGNVPDLKKDDERAVYAVVNELINTRCLEQSTFDEGVADLGEQQMIELISCVGYFTMIAMILVAFDVPLPSSYAEKLIP